MTFLEDFFGRKNVDKGKALLEEAASALEKGVNSVEGYAKEHFYTEGKFDLGKAKDFLKHKAEVVKLYGQEAYNEIKKAVEEGADDLEKLVADYKVFTLEDRKNTGYGLKRNPKELIFWKRYNEAKKFHNIADKTIYDPEVPEKNEILQDIKDHAVTSYEELWGLYTTQLKDLKSDHITHGKTLRKRSKIQIQFGKY